MNETMQMVPVRLLPQRVEEIDELVSILGGNRSEFVRLAVDERLARMRPLLATLASASSADGSADGSAAGGAE